MKCWNLAAPIVTGYIIAGTGSHLPEKRLTNDDLSKIVETTDASIARDLRALPRILLDFLLAAPRALLQRLR